MYIWQQERWPEWRWSDAALATPLSDVSHRQGRLLGRLADIGWPLRERAIADAERVLDGVLQKARFWQARSDLAFNARQTKLSNRLLDGFEGRLTSRRWASMAHCSPDTALRDINDLVQRGVLRRGAAGGRSTWYEIVRPA